ncbi:hypothetical protein F2Q68_00032429 [Brassica cretica]|uniref:Uncharacterized protein n=1 Tax=Brassica cretica TaxID=69181 RepID=A0A8S9GFE6_BRACR|nr:hypothetical protein F2Q68_00032429 [Brassica cretica]
MGEGTLHTEEEPYQENYPNVMEEVLEDVMEAPNEEQYGDGVFQAFEAANEPLYEGCVEELSALRNSEALFSTCSVSMTGTRLPDERAQAVRSLGSLLNYVRLDPRKGYVGSLS